MTTNQEVLFPELQETIRNLKIAEISPDRKLILQPLIDYVQTSIDKQKTVRLNLICTHNSRRSHLSQIWAQTATAYYNIKNIHCYSGGTEATAMFPMVAKTLQKQGFKVQTISETQNPIYSVKFAQNEPSIICFSKKYDDDFNPKNEFAAIMTCSNADEDCPIILGANVRIPITFEDPKAFDNSPQQAEKYDERSVQIAAEMFYVFAQIKQ
jgi:arsenate reductase (thioredoxin)